MLDKIKELFSKRKQAPISLFTGMIPVNQNQSSWTTGAAGSAGYETYAREGYNDNSDVYACINVIARCVKGVNWLVYKKSKNGKATVEVEGNNPLWQLLQRPNMFQSWPKFLENWVASYSLAGNTYIHRNGPGPNKPPTELWLLRPDRMSIIPGNKYNPIAGWKLTVGQESENLLPDRIINGESWQTVLHMKRYNPLDDYYGLSPIQAGGKAVDQSNAAAALNYNLLKNGARIGGAFIVDGAMSEDQYNQVRRQIDEVWSGPNNAGRNIIMGGGITDWKDMQLKPKDMDWLEGQKLGTRRICSIFGVPPEMLGDAQNKTYANFREARQALYQETVLPLLDELVSELNHWLVPTIDDTLLLAYDKDDIEAVKDARQVIWQRVNETVKNGIITPNEARHFIGVESFPDPAADTLRLAPHTVLVGNPETQYPGELPDTSPEVGVGS